MAAFWNNGPRTGKLNKKVQAYEAEKKPPLVHFVPVFPENSGTLH